MTDLCEELDTYQSQVLGLGLRKMEFLPKELPDGVEVMRAIKQSLDPLSIMNPGKVLETEK